MSLVDPISTTAKVGFLFFDYYTLCLAFIVEIGINKLLDPLLLI